MLYVPYSSGASDRRNDGPTNAERGNTASHSCLQVQNLILSTALQHQARMTPWNLIRVTLCRLTRPHSRYNEPWAASLIYVSPHDVSR